MRSRAEDSGEPRRLHLDLTPPQARWDVRACQQIFDHGVLDRRQSDAFLVVALLCLSEHHSKGFSDADVAIHLDITTEAASNLLWGDRRPPRNQVAYHNHTTFDPDFIDSDVAQIHRHLRTAASDWFADGAWGCVQSAIDLALDGGYIAVDPARVGLERTANPDASGDKPRSLEARFPLSTIVADIRASLDRAAAWSLVGTAVEKPLNERQADVANEIARLEPLSTGNQGVFESVRSFVHALEPQTCHADHLVDPRKIASQYELFMQLAFESPAAARSAVGTGWDFITRRLARELPRSLSALSLLNALRAADGKACGAWCRDHLRSKNHTTAVDEHVMCVATAFAVFAKDSLAWVLLEKLRSFDKRAPRQELDRALSRLDASSPNLDIGGRRKIPDSVIEFHSALADGPPPSELAGVSI